MDYFEGQTLADYVAANGSLSQTEAVDLACLVAEGLVEAHGKGILHRDIKPANLLVRRAGDAWQAKVIDFGLALKDSAISAATHSTATRQETREGSSIAGTVDYAAPEQMGKLKGIAVSGRSDIYGFAKTMCYALFLTPQPTFQNWKEIDSRLADLLGRCLNESPLDRPKDFGEVLTALNAFRMSADSMYVGLKETKMVRMSRRLPVREFRAEPAGVVDLALKSDDPRVTMVTGRANGKVRISLRDAENYWETFELIVGGGTSAQAPPPVLAEAPRPRREPPPDRPSRRERPRRDESEPRPAPASGGGKGALIAVGVVLTLLIVLVVVCANFWGSLWPGRGKINNPFPNWPEVKPLPDPVAYKEEDLPKALAELRSTKDEDPPPRAIAAHNLTVTPVVKGKQAEIARALEKLVEDKDKRTRITALHALGVWGDKETGPKLSPIVTDEWDGDVRFAAMDALVELQDERALPAIVSRIGNGWDGKKAVPCVRRFGEKAEPHLRALLREKPATDVFKQHDQLENKQVALDLLKTLGTRATLPVLEELTHDSNANLRQGAEAAITAIEARHPKEEKKPSGGKDKGD
jgi:hypothetical protein